MALRANYLLYFMIEYTPAYNNIIERKVYLTQSDTHILLPRYNYFTYPSPMTLY